MIYQGENVKLDPPDGNLLLDIVNLCWLLLFFLYILRPFMDEVLSEEIVKKEN